ncbi:MAG: UDP-N-acetylglucosamine diphosphorylase/glucosamine-1-phosphate N-acetyltransferase [Nitrospirae bacterium RBG_13_39_12]|nr:MAG: UDP-N-acetylglucosamine diphosphorylase/glucosamine-1-phosphate N-acetyltransferase [Nitrospirae bacterium RBG_13_39_12]
MNSSLPKVLHTLYGNSMLEHVLSPLFELKPHKIIVVAGKHIKEIKESIIQIKPPIPPLLKGGKGGLLRTQNSELIFVQQKEPRGTGNALLKAVPFLKGPKSTLIVVNGDTPLITRKTLSRFLAIHRKKRNVISLLSFVSQQPSSYGRVVRDERGDVAAIVENRDTTLSQKSISEVNSGVYAMEPDALPLLKDIDLNVSKGEYYLTDIIHIARKKGIKAGAYCIGSEDELIGINTQEELERARRLMKERIIKRWIKGGVSFVDKTSVFISSDVVIGKGTSVYPNVFIEGNTKVGRRCTIYPNVRIQNSIICDDSVIRDSSLIEDSIVKNRASVGPFAHIRPGSEIGPGAKIGNFVEVKKSLIGSGTKASHLTYIGDAKIGKSVNIGAGTITCNYDGYKKQVTTIEDNVFIGSDTQFIAPVKIGKGAYIAAGSTITKDVPSKALALSRVKQRNIKNWALKRKSKINNAEPEIMKKRKK